MTVLLEPTGLAVQGLNEQPTTIMLAVAVGAPGADGPPGSGVLPTGGTTGQHLAKASDADQDAEWVDPATGGSQLDAQVVLYCGTLTGDGLTPAEGDLMSRVFHVGGSAVDDDTGLVGWSSLETYEWHAEDERFIGSHVLIIPSDAEQWFGRTVPTVYAEVTEDGFEAIEVAGTTQVNLMCAVGELGQPAPMFGVNGGNEASGGATIPTLAATHFAWPYMTTDEVLTPEGQSVTDWLIAHDNTTGFYLIDLIATTITGTTISVLAKDNSTTDIDVTDKSPGQVVLNLTTGNLLTTTETTFENERNATDGIYITRGAEVDGARGVLVAMFEGAHELFDQDDEGGGDPADQRVHVYDLAATYEGPSYPTGFGDTFGPFTADQRVVFYSPSEGDPVAHPGGHLYTVADDTLTPDGFEFNADTFGHLVSIEKDTDRSDHRSLLKVGIVDPDADPLAYSLFVPNPVTGGGGAVDSVNGQTGTVVLDAADVGAATQGDIDSAVGGLGSAAQADVGDFASAAQGVKADEAFPLSSLANNEDLATIEGGFAAGISRAGLAADPAFTGAFDPLGAADDAETAANSYTDSVVAALDAVAFRGVIDCSTSPNYPAASLGDLYRVSVAGKIGGASGPNVEVGDQLLAIANNAGGTQASVGASWTIAQTNIDGAVIGPASVTDGAVVLFDGTSGRLVKSGGALGTAAFQPTSAFDAAGAAASAQSAAATDATTKANAAQAAATSAAATDATTKANAAQSAAIASAAADATTKANAAVTTAEAYADTKIAAGSTRLTFSNANVTITSTDRRVAQIGIMSASRTATLPAANSVAAGTSVLVIDESGSVTSTNTIVITRAGSDTIDGATTVTISNAYGSRTLYSDGTSKWTFDGGVVRKGEAGSVTSAMILDGEIVNADISGSAGISVSKLDIVARILFGSGVDGDASISGTTTLTQDMYYRNLAVSGTLVTNGFRVFVSGALTGNGSINNDGSNANITSGGGGPTAGTLGAGQNGGAGGTTTGTQPAALTSKLGGSGGAGGTGSSGAGGASQTGTAPAAVAGGSTAIADLLTAIRGTLDGTSMATRYAGGTGGSGGGGDGTAGGGGGAGAGPLVLCARDMSGFTGTISAKGGNGGTPAGGNRGGGGGGAGATAVIVTATSAKTWTSSVAGGTHGNGTGTGTNGSDGGAGTLNEYLGVL